MIINILVLGLMIVLMDKRDLLSLVIVFSYISFIILQLLDLIIGITDREWFFASTSINLAVISMLIMCYDKCRSIIILIYTSLVIGFYVIPDIIQFYGFTLSGYVRVTALTCLIEIMIVGRGYVKRAYNYCCRIIKHKLFGVSDSDRNI